MSFFEHFEPSLPVGHGFQLGALLSDVIRSDFNIVRNIGMAGFGGHLPGLGGILNECAAHLDLNDPFEAAERMAETVLTALRIYEELAERGHHGRGPGARCGGGYSGYDDGYSQGESWGGAGGGFNDGYGPGSAGSGYDGGSSCAPLGPGEQVQARQLFDYFLEQGLTAAQAAGVLGNMQTESGFRTDAYNPGEGAIGLCQWEGGRRTALENFAARQGRPVTDWRVQAAFVMHELMGSENGAFVSLRQCRTPGEAARVFQSQFERSAALTNRAANASNVYHELNGQLA
jgi:hypothetical protein